jgi:hypothetical protein
MGLPGVRWALRGTLVPAAWGLFYVARQPFSPSDWVEIIVRNVPKGLRQIYLIADGRDGPRALNWYHSKVFVFEEPGIDGQEWYRNYPEDQRFAPVQWQNARRYGALAQRSNGTWALWWLGPADLEGPSISRYILGGGSAEIRLPDESRAVAPSRELLKQVGVPDESIKP